MKHGTFDATPVYAANIDAIQSHYRVIVNEGGTSSTKTYSIMQAIKTMADSFYDLHIEVAALNVPHFKNGAMRDLINILSSMGEYQTRVQHNKTDHIFQFTTGSTIEFKAYDDSGKARGGRRDFLFVNEANLFDRQIIKQLMLRTRYKVIMDYNPADEFHWIYDEILPREDCLLIHSTYLDGYDFLQPYQIAEIEALKETDPVLWQIYGLGKRAVGRNKIFPHFKLIDEFPENIDHQSYGVDFGTVKPSAVMRCGFDDKRIVLDEVIYQAGLTTQMLIQQMEQENVDQYIDMFCDSAEADRIMELQQAGYNAMKAVKSVDAGLGFMRGMFVDDNGERRFSGRELQITKRSVNTIKEVKQYKFQEVRGLITDKPVKFMDHALDAGRYGAYSKYLEVINGYESLIGTEVFV